MKNTYVFALIGALSLSSQVLAEEETYCLKNISESAAYVYNKAGQLVGQSGTSPVGKVDISKHITGIAKTDFPLLLSTCSSNPTSGCPLSSRLPNHTISSPGCYSFYYDVLRSSYYPYHVLDLACDICRAT